MYKVARVVIDRGLVRPKTGMPLSWRKQHHDEALVPRSFAVETIMKSRSLLFLRRHISTLVPVAAICASMALVVNYFLAMGDSTSTDAHFSGKASTFGKILNMFRKKSNGNTQESKKKLADERSPKIDMSALMATQKKML